MQGAESGCHTEKERQIVLNCCRLLTRILPYIFEDPDWRGFFWSTVPGAGRGGVCLLAFFSYFSFWRVRGRLQRGGAAAVQSLLFGQEPGGTF